MFISTNITKTKVTVALLAATLVAGCSTNRGSSRLSTASAPVTYWSSTGVSARDFDMDTTSSTELRRSNTSTSDTPQGGTSSDMQSGVGSDSAATSETSQSDFASDAQNFSATGGTNMVIPLYRESVQVGKRVVNAGAVRVRKNVTTETVNHPVQLRTETVVIDRIEGSEDSSQNLSATGRDQGSAQAFQEDEIVIQLKREEPVVQKQIVPAGRVVAEVRSQTTERNIESQIRREEVDVNTIGNPQNVQIAPGLRSDNTAVGGTEDETDQSQGAGSRSQSPDSD